MILNLKNTLLYIEPREALKSQTPLNDEWVKLLEKAILDAEEGSLNSTGEFWPGIMSRGFFTTECGEKSSNIKTRLSLNERQYECEECGYVEDRDTNAAKNILRQGIVEYKSQSKTELAPHLALAL